MILSLRSIRTNNCSADNCKKHFTTLVCGYPSWQLSIDHNMDVYKDVQYQVKHRLYMSWTPSQKYTVIYYKKTVNQSVRTIVAI